jgi:hypothetical protein
MNWQIEVTEQFERDAKRYAKKQPSEYLAVMENLEKYLISIEIAAHPKLVQFGFLHDEPKGIRAVDQSGGALASGKKRGTLNQTRLYSYAALESKVLHLLCLGSKTTQAKDIRYAESVVDALRKESGN